MKERLTGTLMMAAIPLTMTLSQAQKNLLETEPQMLLKMLATLLQMMPLMPQLGTMPPVLKPWQKSQGIAYLVNLMGPLETHLVMHLETLAGLMPAQEQEMETREALKEDRLKQEAMLKVPLEDRFQLEEALEEDRLEDQVKDRLEDQVEQED